MHHALALNDGFGKPNVQFSVIMEMREGFPAEAQRCEPISSARQRTMLYAELFKPFNQLFSQACHVLLASIWASIMPTSELLSTRLNIDQLRRRIAEAKLTHPAAVLRINTSLGLKHANADHPVSNHVTCSTQFDRKCCR